MVQLKKKELIFAILRAQAEQSGLMFMEGVLEILSGRLWISYDRLITCQARKIFIFRLRKFANLICDPVISYQVNVDRLKRMNVILACFKLKPSMERIQKQLPNDFISLRLTPLYPEKKIVLETTPIKLSTRIMDLLAPVGLGQRGLDRSSS